MPQIVLWVVAGSALYRLWGGEPVLLKWCLGAAIVHDLWVTATVRQIYAGQNADVLDTPTHQREAMVFWARSTWWSWPQGSCWGCTGTRSRRPKRRALIGTEIEKEATQTK